MSDKDEVKSNLKRRNSIGKGLNTVSFEVDLLTNKNNNHDKIIIKHAEQLASIGKSIKNIEKEMVSLKAILDCLSKQVNDILDG